MKLINKIRRLYKMKAYNVAVLGATGLVGGTILKILEERTSL